MIKKVLAFRLSPFSYKKYLNPHIAQILQTNPKYSQCLEKIQQTINKNNQSEFLKPKLNMIFNVYSLPEPLSPYKKNLCQFVLNDKISNQSDLDRLVIWLQKNLKKNSSISAQQIENLLTDQIRQTELEEEVGKIIKSKEKNCSVPEICKILREKFICVDSKKIYEKVQNFLKQPVKTTKTSNQFWDKLPNLKPRLLIEECNSPEVYQQHLSVTNGKLRFRFPPEPNGYLHIGHIKAMRINFQTAKRYNGICYLRYDDTNPQTQSHEFIDNILKNVRWLGYEPDKITFASDYFEEMIFFATKLIKDGNAYVCDSSQEEIEEQRKNKLPNPDRSRPIEESLKYFPNLQEGQTLRLKLNPSAKNTTLRDPVIYRVKEMSHPRTGNKYRIYPIYDFAHCICDSLQHIDYSLCSLEFQIRRQLYYSILHLLGLYKPYVWEYSRLNVQGSVISKRKIKILIENEIIDSWEDPRLLTIGGLIRRGYTAQMLVNFIDKVNASRSGNQNVVQFSLLERQMRKILLQKSKKTMGVLQPMPISIIDQELQEVNEFILSNKIYLEKSDMLEEGTYVILKYAGVFFVQFEKNNFLLKKSQETPTSLKQKKISAKVLHWISELDAMTYPIIVYDRLLDAYGQPLPSKITHDQAKIHKKVLQEGNQSQYWQFERLGYFWLQSGKNLIRCTGLK